MSTIKEPRFFVDAPEPYGRWSRGVEWYRHLFPSNARVCGEASPAYTSWPMRPGVVDRMHRLIPDAKLIYLVRDSIQTLKSNCLMARRRGLTKETFYDFLRSPFGERVKQGTHYGTQLSQYLMRFPSDAIDIVESVSLLEDRVCTLQNIFRFPGVDPDFRSPLFRIRRHIGSHEPYLTSLGQTLLSSVALRTLKRVLPRNAFYVVRNIALRPFSTPAPSTELPSRFEHQLREELAGEIKLLKKLSGKPLPSLSI